MRVRIHKYDEWFPICVLCGDADDWRPAFEVDPRTVKRWRRAIKAFEKVQKEMREAVPLEEYIPL